MLRARKGSFQRTLQKTIFLYALIPLLVLIALTMELTRYMLYKLTENDLQTDLDRAASIMDEVESHYLQALQSLSADFTLARALESHQIPTELYEKLYSVTNSAPIRSAFYLLDANRIIIGSSVTTTPAYLSREGLETSPLWQRLKRSDNGIAMAGSEDTQPGLLLVSEVRCQGRLAGYVLFDLPRDSTFAVLMPNSQLMLCDRFRRVIWATDATLMDSQNRVAAEYVRLNGLLQKGSRQFFLSRRNVFHNQLELYAYADTTIYHTIYHVLLVALPCIFLLLTPLLFYAARSVARKNGQAVDKIAAAMQNTRYDTLGQSLEMNTGDEFEKIAISYEKLCRDMRTLIDDNAEIAKQQVISELKQLEAQFNPHFLFNTLEAIRVLFKLDPDAANQAIVALSDLLRYSVNNSIRNVTLVEDMHYTECYLQIQKCRLQEKLDYSFCIGPEARQCMVPKLVVQPLVENAVKYGNDTSGYCNVHIHAFVQANALHIEVTDGGRPLTVHQVEEIYRLMNEPANRSAHNGLYSIHKRLRLAFGENFGIRLIPSSSGSGNCFVAVLPFQKEEING